MKYKTAELTGALLNAAVAKAEGMTKRSLREGVPPKVLARDATFECSATEDGEHGDEFQPSDRWDHGGPIIERELVSVVPPGYGGCAQWTAGIGLRNAYDGWEADHEAEGPTPLIAAMRAFVASKLGEEVELPG
jgi:hypothetical protein